MTRSAGATVANDPTLLHVIVACLSHSDLVTCLRVSSLFYDLAGQRVYRHITIDSQHPLTAMVPNGMFKRRRKNTACMIGPGDTLMQYTESVTLRGPYSILGHPWIGDDLVFPRLKGLHVYSSWTNNEHRKELEAMRLFKPRWLVIHGTSRSLLCWCGYLDQCRRSPSIAGNLERVTLVGFDQSQIKAFFYSFKFYTMTVAITIILPSPSSDTYHSFRLGNSGPVHDPRIPVDYHDLTFVHAASCEYPPYRSFQHFWTTAPRRPLVNYGPLPVTIATPQATFLTFSQFMALPEGKFSISSDEAEQWYRDERDHLDADGDWEATAEV